MKLIKTQDKFILVSGKAEEGDIGYIPFEGGSIKTVGKYFADDWVKVISENPDFSLLSEADCKKIGWVDIEKLALKEIPFTHQFDEPSWVDFNFSYRKDWIKGFNKAQSLTDKMFSLEDMKVLFAKTLESAPSTESHTRMISDIEYRHFIMDVLFNSVIQSLQQTSWNVEVNELNQITKIL